MVKISCDSI